MKHRYNPKNTCATQIEFDLDGKIVKNVKFTNGCSGNLQAIPKLVEGMSIDEIESKLSGITCGFRNTSCADQLTKALKEAAEKELAEKTE